jgi:hypothetical protein
MAVTRNFLDGTVKDIDAKFLWRLITNMPTNSVFNILYVKSYKYSDPANFEVMYDKF